MKGDWFGWAAVIVWLLLVALVFWVLVSPIVPVDAPRTMFPN